MRSILRCWLTFISLFTTAPVWCMDVSGHWTGAVVRDGAIQAIECDFTSVAHELRGTFSIPELGLYNEPLTEVAFQPPEIRFRFLYGSFQATVHDDIEEMVGLNEKWGPPVKLHLKKAPSVGRCRYEEVKFRSGEVELAGTLVVPLGKGPFPATVVVSGSGPEGRRDGPSAWVYRGWGESLAQRGMAALVYDKRGTGESQGKPGDWTLHDLADDALVGARMLRAHPEIDPARVGMLGISQGGWVAPIAAVKEPHAIAFLIIQVGPAVSVASQELDAVVALLKSEEAVEAGIGEKEIAEAQAFRREMFEVAYGRKPWGELEPLAAAARHTPWAKFIEIPQTESDLNWWRRNQYDPAATLRQLTCPTLALFAENDLLVPPATNVPLWQQYLREAGNNDLTIHVFPGVPHGFEIPRRLIGDDWKWPTSFWVWPRKAPGFYQVVAEWLRQHDLSS